VVDVDLDVVGQRRLGASIERPARQVTRGRGEAFDGVPA
jgi:hypothetical protein